MQPQRAGRVDDGRLGQLLEASGEGGKKAQEEGLRQIPFGLPRIGRKLRSADGAKMRKTWIFIVMSACLVGLGGHAAAGSIQFIDRTGTVSATANGNTVTDSLQLQTGDISVTAGTPQPGMDYAIATAQSSVTSDEIHLRLTSGVGEWGNNGEALAQIEVVFRVNQDTPFAGENEGVRGGQGGLQGCDPHGEVGGQGTECQQKDEGDRLLQGIRRGERGYGNQRRHDRRGDEPVKRLHPG